MKITYKIDVEPMQILLHDCADDLKQLEKQINTFKNRYPFLDINIELDFDNKRLVTELSKKMIKFI